MNNELQMSHHRITCYSRHRQIDGQSEGQVAHRQSAVSVFVISDRQWESVILGCDSLVKPSCQSEASQHTKAGSSDKPVPPNNTAERQVENTPSCVNHLIGGTPWDWEDRGPGGQPRAGGLLLILLSLTPDCSLLQPQRTSEQLPHRETMKLVVLSLACPAQLVQQMPAIRVNAAAPIDTSLATQHVGKQAECVLQQDYSYYSYLAAGTLPDTILPPKSRSISCSHRSNTHTHHNCDYFVTDLQFNTLAGVPALSASNQFLKDWLQRLSWSNG